MAGHFVLVVVLMLASRFSHAFTGIQHGLRIPGIGAKASRDTMTRYLTTNILVVGKKNGGEGWISDGCAEYEKRLKVVMNIKTTFLKSDEELVKAAEGSRGSVIALDEGGRQFSSKEFSDYFYQQLEKGGASVTFIIGAYDGLPEEIRGKYPLISLSQMTWTHSMARLLLIEQVYRASEIRKGSGYHKE
ncbi:Alpha/beta knot methyltransferase [Ochromonadaceae sp. CCMP2298]|nr:Alpha/beta knot methyltransferase [Ochromonadaceae sp. CCMP2298]|mmetsp:Transcript_12778/g.28388  ORF Transcript_12778/g.28388 Transcript_12778/m.28388 type:complete len:189 (+) Transcript_12778:124-690(+)